MEVYLIGDGILDNYFWLENKERDLKKELTVLGYNTHNFAIEEMKVSDIINGIVPSQKHQKTRSYPYQITRNNKLFCLEELENKSNGNSSFTPLYGNFLSFSEKKEVDGLAVISIGGNDINASFSNIFMGINYFMNAIITEEFVKNYETIIESAKRYCKKVMLVSVYLPYLGPNSSYGNYIRFAEPMIRIWHDFLHKMAKKYNVPVLDLDRTLNTSERSHYGTNDTRTSNISSKCIARCIDYIHVHYDGYKIYYAPNCNYNKIVIEK